MSRLTEFLNSRESWYWELLAEIVNVESPSGYKQGVDRVGDILAASWTRLGFSETRLSEEAFGDQRVFDRKGSPGLPRLLLVGHMDTVFPLGSGWPFRLDANGRAYGPGVIDMKGGLVSMIAAVEALDRVLEGRNMPSLRVLLNSDEEPGSPQSQKVLLQIVEGCDAAFVLEPSEPDGKIVAERKGVGIFKFEFTGRSAHAGQEPERGLDANEALAWTVIESKKIADKATGTTVNPGVIAGGSVPYAVAEHSVLHLDIRVKTQEEMERVEFGLRGLTKRPFVPGVVVNLSGRFHRPPMIKLPGAEVLLKAYVSAAEENGILPMIGSSGAASDANSLVSLGLPCLDGLGPVGGRAHSTEEYLESETFITRIAILVGTIARVAQAPITSLRPNKESADA